MPRILTYALNLSVYTACLLLLHAGGTSGMYARPAYLFAHMTKSDYGGLYYSVSTDGLNWEMLNNGQSVLPAYRGHPDIMQGQDDRYYMIGVEANTGRLLLWVSDHLMHWKMEKELPSGVFAESRGHKANISWYGAPKLFYDKDSGKYIITWHMPLKEADRNDFAGYWCSMRSFCTTTSDFTSFTPAKKLFDFDMATIDVIIRKEGKLYYAFLKDECEATPQWPTGKSIRVSVSGNLTGPYSYPSGKISPGYREAPMIISKPDNTGWYMYYEQYPGLQYEAAEAPAMAGPWFDVYQQRISVPEEARHGAMLSISMDQYEALKAGFPNISEK